MMIGGAGLGVGVVQTLSTLVAIRASFPLFLNTTRLPVATTRTAAAARQIAAFQGLAEVDIGTTARGTLSSAVKMRDDAAINPRASATALAHCGHSATWASTRAASSALNAPSSHE
jgi:esterase/lipase superfamily enzyme